MIDKHSDTFYWIETVGGIHQRRKSSGFFRNIQEPFKLSEMVIHSTTRCVYPEFSPPRYFLYFIND